MNNGYGHRKNASRSSEEIHRDDNILGSVGRAHKIIVGVNDRNLEAFNDMNPEAFRDKFKFAIDVNSDNLLRVLHRWWRYRWESRNLWLRVLVALSQERPRDASNAYLWTFVAGWRDSSVFAKNKLFRVNKYCAAKIAKKFFCWSNQIRLRRWLSFRLQVKIFCKFLSKRCMRKAEQHSTAW